MYDFYFRKVIAMNPIVSFLPLVGNPSRAELHGFLSRLRDGKTDQILLYPRSGLDVEYMSEDWRRLCTDCIDFARENSMAVWLYDDFNWPSGSCMNRVAHADPNYVAKRFVFENGALRVEKMQIDEMNCTFEPFSVDLFNPDAVDCFITLTHEKYFEWFKKDFGKTIIGFFTDEPSFDYTVAREIFDPAHCRLPYYYGIEEKYQERFGENLRDRIIDYCNGNKCANFQLNYNRMLAERFRDTYVKKLFDWCREHSVSLTGHFYGDNSIYNSIQVTGDIFGCLDLMDLPGTDEIETHISPDTDLIFSQLKNIREHGASHGMAELFGLGPCSLPFARRNQMIWYTAMYGADHFFNISHYDIRGNTKKETFFSNYSPDSPDFFSAPALVASAKLASEYAGKEIDVTFSLRYPFTACASTLRDRSPVNYDRLFKNCVDALNRRQLRWRLIRENEPSRTEFILSFGNGGITEEKSGRYFRSITELDEFLSEIDPGTTVTDSDGRLDNSVMIREFTDGSFVILDIGNTKRTTRSLILHRNGERIPFLLDAFGVFTGNNDASEQKYKLSITSERIIFDSPSLLRADLTDSNEFRFTLTERMSLSFSVRTYEPVPVTLDGTSLIGHEAPTHLPECMKKLYRHTDRIILSKGEHILSAPKDSPFLPVVIIDGDFTCRDGKTLIGGRTTPYGAPFYGKATLVFTVNIPSGAHNIALRYTNNYLTSSLSANGEEIGRLAFAPYIYTIPDRFAGSCTELRLTLHSSMAPVFGKLTDPGVVWGMRVCDPETLDIDGIELVWDM